MKDKLEGLFSDAVAELGSATTEDGLQELRVKYLGTKGALTGVMNGLGALSADGRLEEAFDSRALEIREQVKAARLSGERLDVTLPGRRRVIGSKHPITLVTEEICAIFAALGF